MSANSISAVTSDFFHTFVRLFLVFVFIIYLLRLPYYHLTILPFICQVFSQLYDANPPTKKPVTTVRYGPTLSPLLRGAKLRDMRTTKRDTKPLFGTSGGGVYVVVPNSLQQGLSHFLPIAYQTPGHLKDTLRRERSVVRKPKEVPAIATLGRHLHDVG